MSFVLVAKKVDILYLKVDWDARIGPGTQKQWLSTTADRLLVALNCYPRIT